MSDMDGYRDPICRECGADICACPSDADAPLVCAHGVEVGTCCGLCEAAAFDGLARMFAHVLDRIRERDDETKGAALAARFERGA